MTYSEFTEKHTQTLRNRLFQVGCHTKANTSIGYLENLCMNYSLSTEVETPVDYESAQALWYKIMGKQVVRQPEYYNGQYQVRYHDGIRIHKDGSAFFDIRTFKGKVKAQAFSDALVSIGYTRK